MSPPKKTKKKAVRKSPPPTLPTQNPSYNIEHALANGIKQHQAGNLQQAQQIYQEILSIDPHHAETLHTQAILACQCGQHATAVPLFQKAIHQNPKKSVFHYNLGNALKDLGRLDEAVPCYRQALLLNQNYLEALNNLGIVFHRQGKFDEALTAYQKALQLKPDHAETLYNLGTTLQSQGQIQEALLYYQKALAVKNDFLEVYNQLGNIFLDQGKEDAAIGCFQYAVHLAPTATDGYFNMARALKKQGKREEAIAYYQKTLEVAPDSAIAYNNLGNILREQGRLPEAESFFRRALKIMPNYAEAYSNLANIQWDQQRLSEAEANCRRALELMPHSPEMHSNLGNILKDQGRLLEAEASCRQSLELMPDSAVAHGNLASTLIAQGRIAEAEASLRRALELNPEYTEAFSALLFALNYHPDKSGEEIFEAYREYDKRFWLPFRAAWRPITNNRETTRRLKVGYVSPDFRQHSVRHFLEPLLAHHNKGEVEVYAYAEFSREDAVTARYKGYVDHWMPTMGLSDADLTERIRADGIDILVDLAGQTAKNRLGVFARKPTPVSLTWLGFGYTTGLTAIDYFLTDSAMAPAGSEGLFAETPFRMPNPCFVYRPAEGMGPVNPLPAEEREHVTFGTLTRAIRINHRTIRVWSEILKRVPGSRLMIDSSNYKDATMQADLIEKFAAHGIDRERLEIGFHTPPWDVLRGMDIGLDCFPHNSGTTLFETLYMGVPFITLAGRPSVGRLGDSILQGVGHPEWVAKTEEEYVEIAASLASDLPQLAKLRAGLRTEMESCPLMDEPAFARKVEAAYREMFVTWCQKIILAEDQTTLPETAPKVVVEQLEIAQAEQAAPNPAKPTQKPHAPRSGATPPAHERNKLLTLLNKGSSLKSEALARSLIKRYPQHVFGWKVLGMLLKQQGRQEEALSAMEQVVLLSPKDHEALYNLGISLKNQGRLTESEASLRRSLELKPAYADAHNTLGNTLKLQGRPLEAINSYRRALEIKPNFPEAHNNLGVTLQEQGQLTEAESCYRRALEIKPNYTEAHSNLGNNLKVQGRIPEAETCYRQALKINPDCAEAYSNLGNTLEKQGRLSEAENNYRRALEINPNIIEAHNNLGNTLRAQGRLIESEASLRRALEIKPNFAEAYNNLGLTLQEQGRLSEAETSLHRALALKPNYADAYNNLGNVLQSQNRLTEAEAAYRQTLQIMPDFVETYNNLGSNLQRQGRLAEAEISLRRALELKPDYAEAYSTLLFILNYHPDKSGEEIFEAYREYDERFGIPYRAEWRPITNSRETNRRLKVGYVSPDFRHHSVRHFLEPLLAHHNKGEVEVYAYAEFSMKDAVTARYKGYVDHWMPTMGLSDAALTEHIRADGIDILVDLAGQTAKNRLGVFARKPTPVSLTWLGFGYTTGLTAIDYFLTDSAMAPAGSEGLFAETPFRMPNPCFAYRPAEGMGPVSPLPAKERGHVTFGTLTRAIRINHRTIRVWSEILKRVPGSRLMIDSSNYKDATMQADLIEKFAAHGIDRERLEIGYHTPPWDVLRGTDIGLDCFPHNSGTTLFETLYMGVPFITLAGRPSVGRLGDSILQGVGRPEWVAKTEDEYVGIAVALASDLPQLANLRAGLREEMEACPLMDEPAFARKVETAYREMFVKWGEEKQ